MQQFTQSLRTDNRTKSSNTPHHGFTNQNQNYTDKHVAKITNGTATLKQVSILTSLPIFTQNQAFSIRFFSLTTFHYPHQQHKNTFSLVCRAYGQTPTSVKMFFNVEIHYMNNKINSFISQGWQKDTSD